MQPEYVQSRLNSLAEVDNKVCGLLKIASQIVFTFSELKKGNSDLRPQLEQHVKEFYTDLESAAVQLRQEIRLLDENVGSRLLPINVNKKATGQDDDKMVEQIAILRELLGGEPRSD
ncbi:hypothetical protein HG537_0A03630 [Torulaspora globosa]|uniref:Mediator of RNA polymerase II transcription subunit 11 n=1 Tax=Torulaspora globosa TaxID=48254 RepID=A0A7H9HL87_9SACH|nr:hypothetical protein HG537_0A03630 [Torulaspora sp. CBS 2947]